MKNTRAVEAEQQSERGPNGRPELLGTDDSAVKVWCHVVLDPRFPKHLKPRQRGSWATLFALVAAHMRGNGSSAWPSASTIADELGCSEKSVKNDLAALRKGRLLRYVPRFKKEGQGFEYQPDLPDDPAGEVQKLAAEWRAKMDESRARRVKRSAAPARDESADQAMGVRRSGNGLPADEAMGCPRSSPKASNPGKSRSHFVRPAPAREDGKGNGRPPGGVYRDENAIKTIPDFGDRLAAWSEKIRPNAPCIPAAIRKHITPLLKKHGDEVEDVWKWFLRKFNRAGPKYFAEHYDDLREDAGKVLRGILGPLREMTIAYQKPLNITCN